MDTKFRFYFLILLFIGNYTSLSAQDNDEEKRFTTKPIALVFTDIYSGINKGENPTAIEIQRAYFGYDIQLQKGFSSKIVVDIGSPDNTSAYSLLKRYAYFKSAYLQYEQGKVNVKFGIIPMQLFKVQEKNWGRRYIEKSAADKYKFGTSSDLGVSLNYKVSKFAEIDLSISNGEGNAELQHDNTYKTALGLSLKPYKGLVLRAYADLLSKSVDQITWVSFIGYQLKDKFSIGVEFDRQYNVKNEANENLSIFSSTASYTINSKVQIFGRYDIFRSNILDDEDIPWNISKDGSAIIGGIQYSPIPEIRMALNYQDWVPYAGNLENSSYIYLNIEFGL
ncbi:MAG: hypothetical protein JW857_10055 [Bacteroidales bacterium]|nr:hypothetical protein [Bacteroidales bacterium]